MIFVGKQYRTREGEATAVDTKTQLTTVGSETAPGPLLVPQGSTKLHSIIAAADGHKAAAGSCSSIVRLEGPGLPAGPEVITLNAMGGNVTTGAKSAVPSAQLELDVPVTPGNEILIFGEMCGVDITQVSFGVTLVFT